MFLVRICHIWVNQREYARPTPPQHRVRGLASGLLAFHSKLALYKRNCYSEHGRVELSNSLYVTGTCPKPLHVLHGWCFWDWRGRRELWEVNEPNPGCLVQGSVECRSRTVPRISTNSRCISRPRGPHARYAWDCKRQTTHDYLHAQPLS